MNTDPSGQVAGQPGARQRLAFRRIVFASVVLTLCLVMLGAWVRLTDAGLGCPDWPGCYGKLTPAHASEEISRAVAEQGGEHGPVSMGKAWREMIHRYIAQVLGLLVIGISIVAWRHRHEVGQSPTLPIALVGVVILQGIFGMWTVTLLLKPAIVTGHLIGGLITFALLLWLWLRQQPQPRYIDPEPVAALVAPALVGLALLSVQILLALFFAAFIVFRAMGRDYEASVICSGFSGIALGSTATAVANMTAVAQQHGAAHRAFVIVPLVSGFFVDLANALIIGAMLALQ